MLVIVAWAVAQGDGASAQSEPRLALLIGNQEYPSNPGRLQRPHGDVRDLQRALEAADFTVTRVLDADADRIESAVVAFAGALEAAGPTAVGFFYYAGHGAVAVSEARRRNFMLPARTSIASAQEVALRGVRLDRVVDALENAGAGALFVVYDACRNSFSRGVRGFEVVPERPGLLIALSTMADATTPDDGAYAIALAEEIARPGQPAELAFINATQAVAQNRPRDQLPVLRPALVEPFCFRGCDAPPPPPGCDPFLAARIETASWGDEAFLDGVANSSSACARVARAKLRALERDARYGVSALDGKPVVDGATITQATPAGTVFQDCEGCPEMIVIASGSFMMGSPEDEPGRDDDEGPRRRVTIPRTFAVSRTEVTRGQYAAFDRATRREDGEQCWAVGDDGSVGLRDGASWRAPGFAQTDEHPVVCVTWADATAFAEWTDSRAGGRGYRLLSEAEWEYAARAGTVGRFSNDGDEDDLCAIANHAAREGNWSNGNDRCSDGYGRTTAPVGSFSANPFGLYDVHGNVREWVQDCYQYSYAGAPRNGDARETCAGNLRVLRGGSWDYFPQFLRSAIRDWNYAENWSNNLGFRLARTVSP